MTSDPTGAPTVRKVIRLWALTAIVLSLAAVAFDRVSNATQWEFITSIFALAVILLIIDAALMVKAGGAS